MNVSVGISAAFILFFCFYKIYMELLYRLETFMVSLKFNGTVVNGIMESKIEILTTS